MKRIVFLCVILSVVLAVSAGSQTLLNPQFVTPYNVIDSNTSVANAWTSYRISASPQFKQSDNEQMPGGPGGQVSCQQIWSGWGTFEAGVYQRVTGTVVGQTYRAKGWFMSICDFGVDHSPIYQDGSIYQKIGIDPTGGTDPNSANIIWSWDDSLDRNWRELQVDAVANASAVTVFARTRNVMNASNCLSFYDAFTFGSSNPVRFVNDSTGKQVYVRPGTDSATICWTTDVPADANLDYAVYKGDTKSMTHGGSSSVYTTKHSFTLTGLTPNTKYYYKITSTAAGKDMAKTFGIFTTFSGTNCATINELKTNPDATRVFVQNKICTAGTNQLDKTFFISESNRISGIRVEQPILPPIPDVPAGSVVDVCGIITTNSSERRLMNTTVSVIPSEYLPAAPAPIEPLGIRNTAVGGGRLDSYDPGITTGIGPNNIGTLVTVWGRITAVDTARGKYLYLDDGSHYSDGTLAGRYGMKVTWFYFTTNTASIVPVVGKYAIATGLVSCFSSSGNILPRILLRSAADFIQF